MIISITEAKKQLSKLLIKAQEGEVITITKYNHPVADLIPHCKTRKRRLGILKGQYFSPENLLDEDEEINSLFYMND